jgi:hypothetical protein
MRKRQTKTRVAKSIAIRDIMHKLKQFSISLGGLLLRLVLVIWLFAIVDLFCKFEGRLTFSLIFFTFWTLQFTKWDIKFIAKNIDKWQFEASFFLIYSAAWAMALYKYYVTGGFERGLAFVYDTFIIAPLSEALLCIFVYLPLNLVSQNVIDIYGIYFHVPVSISVSFVVLWLLLKLAKRILRRIEKLEVSPRMPWVCTQLVLFVIVGTTWFYTLGNVSIGIENYSGKTIQTVTVTYKGGTMEIGPLQDRERRVSKIRVTEDSNLRVSVRVDANETDSCLIGVFLNQYNTKDVEIIVGKNLSVVGLNQGVFYECRVANIPVPKG